MKFTHIVQDIGQAGVDLTVLEAAEGSAGNISVFVRELGDLDRGFVPRGTLTLPSPVPALAGGWLVLTAAGRRLRDVERAPAENLVVLSIHDDGGIATWHAANALRPTSEWNSHLAVHADQVSRRELAQHAFVHAQPHCLTYLSHHPDYGTADLLTRRILRWEPETIMTFPEGFGLVPFHVPGSAIQMQDTLRHLQPYKLVVWQRHGVVARSDESASHAANLVEYAEMAARYEVQNLELGNPSTGLSDDDLRAICREIGLPMPLYLS